MIRHRHGSEFWLFTQHDHALLCGRIAEHLAGGVVAKPSPQTIQGIALHDCGWPLHDQQPTLNARGEPLHVFEASPQVTIPVWSASARRAAAKDPYCGLLVSLHVLNLSVMSQVSHPSPQEVFQLNKFQHAQIELQENLRTKLGMRTDLPLTRGLARQGTSPAEDTLLFDYRLLRGMDQLSLAALCSENPFPSIDGLLSRPGGPTVDFHLERPGDFTVRLDPWPFAGDDLEFPVPFHRLPAEAFDGEDDFRQAYAESPRDVIDVRLVRSDR